MKRGNEQKRSTINRLISLLVKPIPEEKQVRWKPAEQKFQYQLPSSFVQAVNDARMKEGYDILPRFDRRSLAARLTRQVDKHQRKKPHASSKSGVDQPIGKSNQLRQQQSQKKLVPTPSTGPLPRKTTSRARRRPSN